MRKIIKGFFITILSIILLAVIAVLVSGKTYLFKAVYYNYAGIDDYKIFTNDTVATAAAQPWAISEQFNKVNPPDSLNQLLTNFQTVAVVVIKNDSLLYEKYWDGYSDSSYSNSFSVAKSITSLLVGAAIKEGKIQSVDDLVSKYIPEFKEGMGATMKIKDLLTMSSGSNWDEAYSNPLSVTTEAYYGSNVANLVKKVKIQKTPGSYHTYKSGDTELLALIVEKVTGKTLPQYASEKLWQPIGAEHAALWSTDKDHGTVKAYCCFNTNARDFARVGQLMLDSGKWKGNAIIDSSYYVQSVSPCNVLNEQGKPCANYGYQWWLAPSFGNVFYARGILGQYIIVIPSKNMVIVRLGHKRSDKLINGVHEIVNGLINWGNGL